MAEGEQVHYLLFASLVEDVVFEESFDHLVKLLKTDKFVLFHDLGFEVRRQAFFASDLDHEFCLDFPSIELALKLALSE